MFDDQIYLLQKGSSLDVFEWLISVMVGGILIGLVVLPLSNSLIINSMIVPLFFILLAHHKETKDTKTEQ